MSNTAPGDCSMWNIWCNTFNLFMGINTRSLRTPNTLEAIEQLCHESIITLAEREALNDDYLFLRQLIDGLRIVRGNAKDLVLPPSGSDEMVFLARRLGMGSTDWQKSAEAFEQASEWQKFTNGFLHDLLLRET